jgi:hypothetical protein
MGQASGFCPHCGEQRLLLREGPNHVLHLILSVLTFGLWLIVWFVIAARKQDAAARCSVCGTELRKVFAPGHGTTWQG